MEAVLTDTSVVVEYLRSRDKGLTLLIKLMQQFDIFVSSITEFELFLGAKTDRHMYDLEMFFDEADVLPFDFGCGRIASDIWNGLRQKHQHAEIRDVFIASIAIQNDIRLCTLNKKHFSPIPNLKIMDEKQIW